MNGLKALENRKLGIQLTKDAPTDFDRNARKTAGVRSDNSSAKSVVRTANTNVLVSNDGNESANRKTTLEISKDTSCLPPSLTAICGKAPILDLNSQRKTVNQKGGDSSITQAEDCKIMSSLMNDDDPSYVELREKVSERIRAFENVGEHTTDDSVDGGQVVSKYPSKLHEKLAMLEGKVQRIASEIKQTKEMLDLNNPMESKLILTDIQNKISGIEKAVGHAIEGTNLASSSETTQINSKVPMKGLNYEELEARFFPHHKLIRNQTSIGSSGGNDESHTTDLKDGSQIPIDENPVALEFLASLVAEPKIVSTALRELGMEKISSSQQISNKTNGGNRKDDISLMANEKLDEFDDQENQPAMVFQEMTDESTVDQLVEIGRKTSTGGWFVSEGEAILLAHEDGSCSYYDIANLEVKAEYHPPTRVSNSIWGDCWLIRAPGADGCSGRYVVAASAGNSQDSGFCSWDFYTKDVKAFHVEEPEARSLSGAGSRSVLAPISNSEIYRRSVECTIQTGEPPQWWYRPCGPLLVSTSSRQKTVNAYDIRDGDMIMKWDVESPVLGMEYSSPLQWRSRGKLIVAETEKISLWDVNSLTPQPLISVPVSGKKLYSLHVNNTDAEIGGGVRQRVASSEVDGNDGVFCTHESINIFDFRLPSGIGLKIPRNGANGYTIFSRGDSIYIGCTEGRLSNKASPRSQVQHFSLRKGKLSATYALPDFNAHIHQSSLTQVWGNSNMVMGVCGMGLFVFDAVRNDGFQTMSMDQNTIEANEVIGPDDLYFPTFDYLGSRVLVISRDRPALWKYLS